MAAAFFRWSTRLFEREKLWRPLKRISLMVDYAIWGPEHPGGFHATNLLFHAATALLLSPQGFSRIPAVVRTDRCPFLWETSCQQDHSRTPKLPPFTICYCYFIEAVPSSG